MHACRIHGDDAGSSGLAGQLRRGSEPDLSRDAIHAAAASKPVVHSSWIQDAGLNKDK